MTRRQLHTFAALFLWRTCAFGDAYRLQTIHCCELWQLDQLAAEGFALMKQEHAT